VQLAAMLRIGRLQKAFDRGQGPITLEIPLKKALRLKGRDRESMEGLRCFTYPKAARAQRDRQDKKRKPSTYSGIPFGSLLFSLFFSSTGDSPGAQW
jgi:hypothetical protein